MGFSLVSVPHKHLLGLFHSPSLLGSPYRAAHTADALRLLLLYRYGGLYLDLDFVVLHSLERYTETYVSNVASVEDRAVVSVCNGVLGLPARHPVLARALALLNQSYDPACWGCVGPALLSQAVRQAGNLTANMAGQEGGRQAGLQVLPRRVFLPVHWTDVKHVLFSERPQMFDDWARLLRDSSAVHFASSLSSGIRVRQHTTASM